MAKQDSGFLLSSLFLPQPSLGSFNRGRGIHSWLLLSPDYPLVHMAARVTLYKVTAQVTLHLKTLSGSCNICNSDSLLWSRVPVPSSILSYGWPSACLFSHTGLISVPGTCYTCSHRRAFALAIPFAWNALPAGLPWGFLPVILVSAQMSPSQKPHRNHPMLSSPPPLLFLAKHLLLSEMTLVIYSLLASWELCLSYSQMYSPPSKKSQECSRRWINICWISDDAVSFHLHGNPRLREVSNWLDFSSLQGIFFSTLILMADA